jgi:putative methyltransferase (TIGR04325 family)
MSSGYDNASILERVAAATREVVAGRATYERDSVLFFRPEFRFPVVAALLHEGLLGNGCLDVVDFGGALGSAYWQSRPFLKSIPRVNWRVVEQPHFVALGCSEFANEQLTFHGSIAEASAGCNRGLTLLGGVLRYVQVTCCGRSANQRRRTCSSIGRP